MDTVPENTPPRGRLREAAAEATGFGAPELRMTRDLVLDPHRVLLAQSAPGPDYPRPLRYYLTFNGLYLLVLGLLGGFEGRLGAIAPDRLAPFVAASGKSLDSFMADMDQWYSVLVVPFVALSFYPVLRLLFRRWSINGRAATGQTFTFMSGWSLWGAPFGLAAALWPPAATASLWLGPVIVALLFFRMGLGVWWTTTGQFVTRFLILFVLTQVAMILAGLVVLLLATLGATWGP